MPLVLTMPCLTPTRALSAALLVSPVATSRQISRNSGAPTMEVVRRSSRSSSADADADADTPPDADAEDEEAVLCCGREAAAFSFTGFFPAFVFTGVGSESELESESSLLESSLLESSRLLSAAFDSLMPVRCLRLILNFQFGAASLQIFLSLLWSSAESTLVNTQPL